MYTNLEIPVTKKADETASVKSSADPTLYNPRGLTVRIVPAIYVSAVIEVLTADGRRTDCRGYAHSTDPATIRKLSRELIEEYNRMLDFDGEPFSVIPPGTYNPHGATVKVTGNSNVKAAIEVFHADGTKTHVTEYTHSHDPRVIVDMTKNIVEKYNVAQDFGPSRIQQIPAGTYNPRGVTVKAEATVRVGVRLCILDNGRENEFTKYTHSYDSQVVEAKVIELVEEYNRLKEIESN